MHKYINVKILPVFLIIMVFLTVFQGAPPLAYNADSGPFVDPEIIKGLEKERFVPVIVSLSDPLPASQKWSVVQGTTASAEMVAHNLQERTRAALAGMENMLEEEMEQGNIRDYRSLWIVNAFAASINEAALLRLAELPQIEAIRPDRPLPLEPGTAPALVEREERNIRPAGEEGAGEEPPWNLELINAPAVWQEGITGKDIVIAIMDTGVDPDHPTLRDKYRGNLPGHNHATSWFDVTETAAQEPRGGPRDPYGHGTHVAGIILGGSPEEPLGVAPGAKWMGVNIFEDGTTWDSYITQAFQWLLAPAGDPKNAPRIINCSWASRPEYVSDYLQWEILHNLKQAGIFVVFAAGNNGFEGPGSPASYPHAFSAGALMQAGDEIRVAPFSSRGPVNWQGMSYVKPEITAPGTNIRSAWKGGGYSILDGTSTAAAHVSGSAALLLEARPGISPSEMAYIIKQTAGWYGHWNYLGERPNGTYGYGLLNAAAAVRSQKLNPPELIFYDGADEGINKWTTSPANPWETTKEKVQEGESAFADSPGNHYPDNAASWLALKTPIPLCGYHDPVLTVHHYYDLPRGEKREDDYGVVEFSTDGQNWLRLYRFKGSSGKFTQSSMPLKLPEEASHFYLRFRLQSNGNGPGVGWYIDNISVTARPRPLSQMRRLVLIPERSTIGTDEETTVEAKAFFCDTYSFPLEPAQLAWDSTNPEVALVEEGRIKALAPGLTEIEVTFAGHSAWFSLEVMEVPAPVTFPAPGVYINNVTVILSSAMPGAKIYYTLDGSEPDENSNLYLGPLLIRETTELKARAYASGIFGEVALFTYTVKEGELVRGSLQLQHRPFTKDNMKVFAICQAQGERYHVTTLDNEGYFSIELPFGSYKLVAKHPRHLAVAEPFELAEKGEYSLPPLQLPAGDINGDNHIDLTDLALLSLAYGTTSGDDHWDARADLNGDGRVDITDLTILTRNYGKYVQIP